ncbi:hypothetical protein OS493_033539 [Desmophyllum pertusum]|uniref:Gametocyte-specific factor 1 n=1 Tax=Desmophyllum pertusum TaxID=174260 RepID=A0A9W9Z7X7_9CNID|nr:hypothetical protein OS493_033539 [Desmophyllum pertusum]
MTSNVENDPLQLKICPYDPVHRVAAKRFPYHLQKCRKQYASAGWTVCPFHARHEIPIEELDYHTSICEYKDIIRQDIEEYSSRPIVEKSDYSNHNQPQQYCLTQQRIGNQADSQPFSIIGAEPQEEGVDAYDIVQAMQEVQVQAHAPKAMPVDTSGMTAAQKKNFKRAQKRQEKRTAEGIDEEPVMTDEERLAAIAKQYAVLNNRTSASFVDFVSILNQYCQKNRINVPKYGEAPGVQGGFGAQVFVKGQIFTTMKYCLTKKEARHDAAKCALLGLNIAVVDPTPNKPMAARTATDRQRLRETHELQLLNEAGQPQPRGRGKTTSTPSSFSSSATGPPMSQQPSHNEAAYDFPEMVNGGTGGDDDQWTTVGKKGVKNPVYQHSLKMAGRGRGMSRK